MLELWSSIQNTISFWHFIEIDHNIEQIWWIVSPGMNPFEDDHEDQVSEYTHEEQDLWQEIECELNEVLIVDRVYT